MRKLIRRDALTDTRYIYDVADDAPLPADAMALSNSMLALMLGQLGVTETALPAALSALTGKTFVNGDGSGGVTPPESFTRYLVRPRNSVLDIRASNMTGSTRIATSPLDSVFSAADWALIVAQVGDGDEAATLAGIAQAAGCTSWPDALPKVDSI